MLRPLVRIINALVLIGFAAFLLTRKADPYTLPHVLFPAGLLVAGIGTFLHGPLDPLPKTVKEASLAQRVGIGLACLGAALMLVWFVLFAFG